MTVGRAEISEVLANYENHKNSGLCGVSTDRLLVVARYLYEDRVKRGEPDTAEILAIKELMPEYAKLMLELAKYPKCVESSAFPKYFKMSDTIAALTVEYLKSELKRYEPRIDKGLSEEHVDS